MGRGGNDKAISQARQLLFGPRVGRPMPAATRKRLAQEERSRKRNQTKQDYMQAFDEAEVAIFEGSGEPLRDLLAEPAGYGLKGLEKERIGRMVRSFDRYSYSIARIKEDEVLPLKSDGDIEGLVLLVDRCRERELASGTCWDAEHFLSHHALARANINFREELRANAAAIGELPRVVHGDDFEDHLDAGGQRPLCGKAKHLSYDPSRVDQFDNSAASEWVSCSDCLDAYKRDRSLAEHLPPSKWAAMLDDLNYDTWGRDNHYGTALGHKGDASTRGQELIDSFRPGIAEQLNQMIESFSDYRFN